MQIADAEKIVPQNSPHTTTRKGASPPCRAAYHVVVSGTLLPSGAWPPCRARTSCCLVSLTSPSARSPVPSVQLQLAKCLHLHRAPTVGRHATPHAWRMRHVAHTQPLARGVTTPARACYASVARRSLRRGQSQHHPPPLLVSLRSFSGRLFSLRSFSLPCRHASRITLRSLGRLSHSRPLVANTPNVAISTLTHAAATGQPEAAARQAAARALQQPRAAEPSPPAPALRWSPPPPLPARPRHAQPQSCS